MAAKKTVSKSGTKRDNARGARPKPKRPIAHDNGRGRRRTPTQLDRQARVYMLSVVDGKTVREIAAIEKINPDTVTADLRHEYARRSAELDARRESETARSISYYEHVGQLAKQKSEMYDGIAKAGGKVVDHTLDAMIKSRERIDKLLGIESPTKVEVGIETLLGALKPK